MVSPKSWYHMFCQTLQLIWHQKIRPERNWLDTKSIVVGFWIRIAKSFIGIIYVSDALWPGLVKITDVFPPIDALPENDTKRKNWYNYAEIVSIKLSTLTETCVANTAWCGHWWCSLDKPVNQYTDKIEHNLILTSFI